MLHEQLGKEKRTPFYCISPSGEVCEEEVVQMYEGLYFGELALIYGEPRSASVRAKGEVQKRLSMELVIYVK